MTPHTFVGGATAHGVCGERIVAARVSGRAAVRQRLIARARSLCVRVEKDDLTGGAGCKVAVQNAIALAVYQLSCSSSDIVPACRSCCRSPRSPGK